jgi:alpha-D-xyloside xylohydrolase
MKKNFLIAKVFFIIILFFSVDYSLAFEVKNKNYVIVINEKPWSLTVNSIDGKLIVKEGDLNDDTYRPLSYYNNGWQYISEVISIENKDNVYTFFCKTTDNRDAKVVITAMDKMIEVAYYPPEDAGYVKEVLTSGANFNSHFYGFGQRFNSTDQRGSTLDMWNIDQPKTFGTSSYINVPFFFEIVNEEGILPGSMVAKDESRFYSYGFYMKNTSKSTFKMCSEMRKEYAVIVDDNKINYIIFIEKNPAEIVKSYVKLTGLPELPPPWVFAPWKSRDAHYSEKDVFEDVDMMRSLDIPMSVLVIDSPWETAYNDFTFNTVQFPDYENMIKYIHNKGNKLVLWITPFTNIKSNLEVDGQLPLAGNYSFAEKNGYFVKDSDGRSMSIDWWKGTGGAIDFTNAEAIKWWQDNIEKLVNLGVDGFKTDDGEYIPYNAVFSNGLKGKDMHNIYPLLYNKVTYEILDRITGEAILFARSGWAGSQVYPAVWAGDQEATFNYRDGLPAVIIAGLNMALSGFSFWSHDIGGYRTPPDKEVFIRWAQFGCFTPIMQIHGQNREPWKFDDETVNIYRKYAKLHTSLFPYIYTFSKIASEGGLPVIRPLVLEYPEDNNVYNEDFEYLFGKYFLVAPVYRKERQRQVYLPEGKWYDYWNNTKYSGPLYLIYEADLDRIPLFIKEGAIIPKITESVDTLVERKGKLDKSIVTIDDALSEMFVDIYTDGEENLTIYDETNFRVSSDKKRTILYINNTPGERFYNLNIHSELEPKNITVNGKNVDKRYIKNNIIDNKYDVDSYYYDKVSRKIELNVFIKENSKIIVGY